MKEIPVGVYCYKILSSKQDGSVEVQKCPYWSRQPGHDLHESGYCSYLKRGDWQEGPMTFLWDQVKECEINMDRENE